VVERYFTYRARDPVRALRLMTPAAQLAHGLRLMRILGLPPLPPEPGLSPEAERSLELARARVAWLELYNLIKWMQPIASALDVSTLAASDGEVQVLVAASGDARPQGANIGAWPFPSFAQRFTLAHAGDAWQITAIEQASVTNENAVQAFVAVPTMAGFERVHSLGWRPPWERAISALLRESQKVD
jgi:hypothetical protein